MDGLILSNKSPIFDKITQPLPAINKDCSSKRRGAIEEIKDLAKVLKKRGAANYRFMWDLRMDVDDVFHYVSVKSRDDSQWQGDGRNVRVPRR